jgi:hypothetical protein
MVPWLFVIDDFLMNAEAVRAEALTLNYKVPGKYPGLNSVEKISLEGLDQAVSNIVCRPLHAPWPRDFSHRNCRLSLASDNTKPARIHVDVSQWTGVLCLSRTEDCVGGTELYRHKRTGLDRVPMDEETLKAAGYASYDEVQKEILDKDALDRSEWELAMNVPMRFNRLILIQPHYWHTAGPGFGDSVENGRLVYLMFFNVVAPPAS